MYMQMNGADRIVEIQGVFSLWDVSGIGTLAHWHIGGTLVAHWHSVNNIFGGQTVGDLTVVSIVSLI